MHVNDWGTSLIVPLLTPRNNTDLALGIEKAVLALKRVPKAELLEAESIKQRVTRLWYKQFCYFLCRSCGFHILL